MNSPDRQLKIIRKKVSITSVIFTLPPPPQFDFTRTNEEQILHETSRGHPQHYYTVVWMGKDDRIKRETSQNPTTPRNRQPVIIINKNWQGNKPTNQFK